MKWIHTGACTTAVEALAYALIDERERVDGMGFDVQYLTIVQDRGLLRVEVNGPLGFKVQKHKVWRHVRSMQSAVESTGWILLAHPELSIPVGGAPEPIRFAYARLKSYVPRTQVARIASACIDAAMYACPGSIDALGEAARRSLASMRPSARTETDRALLDRVEVQLEKIVRRRMQFSLTDAT